MLRRLILNVVLLMSLGVLIGCGGAASSTPQPAPDSNVTPDKAKGKSPTTKDGNPVRHPKGPK